MSLIEIDREMCWKEKTLTKKMCSLKHIDIRFQPVKGKYVLQILLQTVFVRLFENLIQKIIDHISCNISQLSPFKSILLGIVFEAINTYGLLS